MSDGYHNFLEKVFNFNKYQLFLSIMIIMNCLSPPTIVLLIPIMTIQPDFSYQSNNQVTQIIDKDLFCNNDYYTETYETLQSKIIIDDSKVYNWGSELKIVCNNALVFSLVSTFYFIGSFTSNYCFINFADLYGRKKIFTVFSIVNTIAHINLIYLVNYSQIIISSYLIGVCSMNINIGIMILSEYIDNKRSGFTIGILNSGFSISGILFVGVMYFFGNYKVFLYFMSFVGIVGSILTLLLLRESPKWLLLNFEVGKFVQTIRKIGEYEKNKNKYEIDYEIIEFLNSEYHYDIKPENLDSKEYFINLKKKQKIQLEIKEHSVFVIFAYDSMRSNSFKLFFLWIVCGFCFYGLLLNINGITNSYFSDSIFSYIAIFISSVFGGYYAAFWGIKFLISSLAITSICCFIITITNIFYLKAALLFLSALALSSSFNLLFIFTINYFPSSVKSNALTFLITISRISSALIPFVFNIFPSFLLVISLLCGIACFVSSALPEPMNYKVSDFITEDEVSLKNN